MGKPRKRANHFQLLEVLIALMIVSLCIIPLIYPQAMMHREQKQFLQELQIDHIANLAFADLFEKLHKNDKSLPWESIKNTRPFTIQNDIVQSEYEEKKIPVSITYKMDEMKDKIDKYHLYKVIIDIIPLQRLSKEHFYYEYELFIETPSNEPKDEKK